MTSVSQQSADETPTVAIPKQAGPVEPPPAEKPAEPWFTRTRAIVIGAATVVVLAGSGTVAYVLSGDVPRGTRVLGVDLGAKSRADAEKLLIDTFGPRAGEPVRVRLDGKPGEVEPAAIGMTLDIPATVAAAMQGGVELFGERIVDPVIRLDQAKLEKVLRGQLDPKDITLKKPGITYAGLTPKPTYPAPGRTLDPALAATNVRRAWLTTGTADVPLVDLPPVTG